MSITLFGNGVFADVINWDGGSYPMNDILIKRERFGDTDILVGKKLM